MTSTSFSEQHCIDGVSESEEQADSSLPFTRPTTTSVQASASTSTSSQTIEQSLTDASNFGSVIQESAEETTQSDLDTMFSQGSSDYKDHHGDDQRSIISADETGPLASFEVAPFLDKGLGIRATRNITKCAELLSEPPLITCPTTTYSDRKSVEQALDRLVDRLCEKDRDFFLHSLTDSSKNLAWPLTGRVRTNALPCGRKSSHGAVYRNISLANHSCIPNAEYQWNAKLKQGVLCAVTDIAAGEEITISYIDIAPHKQRQQKLKACFDFLCGCSLCKMSKKHRREEDKRIRETIVLETMLYNDPRELRHDLNAAFARYQRLAVLYTESRQNRDKDLDRLWAGIADLCVANLLPEQAVDRLMGMTEVPLDMAVEVVRVWYAEYEDEP